MSRPTGNQHGAASSPQRVSRWTRVADIDARMASTRAAGVDARAASKLDQLEALHLARRPLRQMTDEAQVARRFVAPERAHAVRAQVVHRARRARLDDDAGEDLLAVGSVWNTDRRRLEHGRVQKQRLVDLARRDVLAALDDQFLEPSRDEEVSGVIAVAEIAGREPAAVANRGRGRLGRLVIA